MSTLKVATIQDTSGNNSSTPAGIASGTAKAWVNFNGTGTVAIRDDFNVASITDNGTGDYTVNFTTAMANANYCLSGTVADLRSGTSYRWIVIGSNQRSNFAKTTSSVRFQAAYSADNIEDAEHVTVVIHGA
jgi:hypothetical protein